MLSIVSGAYVACKTKSSPELLQISPRTFHHINHRTHLISIITHMMHSSRTQYIPCIAHMYYMISCPLACILNMHYVAYIAHTQCISPTVHRPSYACYIIHITDCPSPFVLSLCSSSSLSSCMAAASSANFEASS